jgi:hypothetical protein
MIEAEVQSADHSRSHRDRMDPAATPLKHHAGAVHHVLTLAPVTHAVPPHMAKAVTAIVAAHRRQGGGTNLIIVTASPKQTDLTGKAVDVTATAAVLAGQAVALQGGPTRTEIQQHWDESKALQIQVFVAQHQMEKRTRFHAGTIVMVFANTAKVAISITPTRAGQ